MANLLQVNSAFGRAICPVIEGTRPLLVEVQALVGKAAYASPRRVAVGVTEKRVAMLLAVLERYAGIEGIDFVNVTDSALAKMRLSGLAFGSLFKQRLGIEPPARE